MSRRLTPHQLSALFVGTWKRSHGDLDACLEAIYDAGRASAVPRKPPRLAPIALAHLAAVQTTAAPIIAAVALLRGLSKDQLMAPTKPGGTNGTAYARGEVAWLLRQLSDPMEYRDIGAVMGWSGEASACKAVSYVEWRIAKRPGLRGELLGLVAGRANTRRSA